MEHSKVGRLPSELTSFVGRRRELAEVKQQLQMSRLVTLTGTGGVGKTRLALKAAAAVHRAFKDSVWLIEVGELRDPSLLADTVASSLGLVHRTNRPIRQALFEYLATRQLLLILDNCEHLLDATAEFAQSLLKAGPELRILATSRERLNIDGESVVGVPPLTIPAATSEPPADSSTVSDAVILFAERARSHVPGFRLTAANRNDVIRICQRLDGLPLPIELAAARLHTLSTSQILEHLTDRYQLLTAGRRGAPSRQQTLRSSVDWSYNLCGPDEQRLWARLSLFAGGAELDAIEGICAEGQTTDMLDLVGSLVDKSILIRDEPGSNVRYRMLDTLREYGRKQLVANGEYDGIRRRHRDWYGQLASRAANEWVSARHSAWAARLGREQANLREAMEYCFEEARDEQAGVSLATTLYPFWLISGHFSEGRRWLDRAADALSAEPRSRADAILLDSVLAGLQGDTQTAGALIDHARAITDVHANASTGALAQHATGLLALYRGEPDRASVHLQTATEMFEADSNTFLQFGSLLGLGLARLAAGNVEGAINSLDQALALTAIGELPALQVYPLWALGISLWLQGDSEQAADALRRGLERIRRVDDPLALAWCLEILAWIAADNNLERRAATLIGAAATLSHQLGGNTVAFPDMRTFQDRCEQRARRALGTRKFESARERGAGMRREEAIAFALEEHPSAKPASVSELTKLTKREQEVAALVAEGFTNRAIAEDLVIAPRTAQGHVENILIKLGFTSRSQIAVWVAEQQ
ncbi:ATP-binding protein [Rhodococcus sp. NPDC127530]|uniref:ATP-binding protein n=1 Tax=unclassified Rhodococcus (in: high G+C Gram-positive bacteria) TaxID=192944 RepID=UPI00362BB6A1